MIPLSAIGFVEQPIFYSLADDNVVAIILFACFFLVAIVLSKSRKFLAQLMNNFIMNRERVSIFSSSTASEVNNLFLLLFVACILLGICIYTIFLRSTPQLILHIHPVALLGMYVGAVIIFLLLKWGIYSLLGWTFFGKDISALWVESYSTLIYFMSFFLFILALLGVYVPLSLNVLIYSLLFILFVFKLMILYKWINLFSINLYGFFFLILYFCAVEIMPCILAYMGLCALNNLLIIKF